MKKTFLTIVAFLIAISLVGCSPSNNDQINNESESNVNRNHITLAYCFNDVVNPYKAKTEINQKLSHLLFDSLVEINENFCVEYQLADNISISNRICKVFLKDTTFSDGSNLTASDVIYSAELAKESKKYSTLFSNVSKITADNPKTVVIELNNNDINFESLLTFPIIKYGTSDLKTDNDLSLPPIGCGKYIPDFTNLKLVLNDNYHSNKPSEKQINLINIPDMEALEYSISCGKISFWSDIYKGADTLTANGGTISQPANHFIYLGINSFNEILNIPQMRYALTSILDRSSICNDIFNGYAISTSGLFNPNWDAVKNIQENIDKPNNNIFLANLEEIGYNRLDSNGYRLTNIGKSFSFKLVYCNETALKTSLANEICCQLNKSGIKTEPVGLSFNDYIKALDTKNFDLYLAETIIDNNMDYSHLLFESGKLNYGGLFNHSESDGDAHTTLEEAFTSYHNGEAELYNIVNIFNLQMPIIPICYKSNAFSYQKNVAGSFKYSPSDPYYAIMDCYIK